MQIIRRIEESRKKFEDQRTKSEAKSIVELRNCLEFGSSEFVLNLDWFALNNLIDDAILKCFFCA